MKRKSSLPLIAFAVAAFVAQAVMVSGIGPQPTTADSMIVTDDKGSRRVMRQDAPKPVVWGLRSMWATNYNANSDFSRAGGLSPDQLLFVLAGFREMIAGILWVRADSFFERGNYDAILPIIRLVTILDPRQIDVFATGMWHIGYNFTDEQQRSDRRYIPTALALGAEGAAKNPETYEMFFETGWMWYHKIDDDYSNAVKWFEDANVRKDMLPARRNLLGMAYQREGRPDKALSKYLDLYGSAVAKAKADGAYGNVQNRDTLESNADNTLVRMSQRGWFASQQKRSLEGYDVMPPFDTGFSVKVSVVEPKILRFQGTWNVLPVGTRIRAILKDAEFDTNRPAGMKWWQGQDVNLDPKRDLTYMQEQLFVKNRGFRKDVDMSKDPTMYPFLKDKYVLEFYYNPRSAPPHIQDKFSWDGTGMTDTNFLNTSVREGQRVVFARLEMTRDQILRMGEWTDKVPSVKTANYKETGKRGTTDDVIIDLPSLRAN